MKEKKIWIIYTILFLCNVILIAAVILGRQYSLILLCIGNIIYSIYICSKCRKNVSISSKEHKYSILQFLQTSTVTVSFFLLISQEMITEKCFPITCAAIVMTLISGISGWYDIYKKK